MHALVRPLLFRPRVPLMAERTTDDDILIARVASQDRRALELLYDKYAPAVMGLAVKIVGDRNAAEEIVQEAFWRVWRRASTYSARRGKFTSWLFGITHNLAIDEVRRHSGIGKSTSVELEDDSLAGLADVRTDVFEAAFQRVTGEQVRSALAVLPDPQRRVIELAFFEGLTHQEIADKLGEPIGTVHTRARLALNKLREKLQALRPDEVSP